MAVAAGTVWEIRTTGASTNGGGYVTGSSGSDFSQQDAAQYALTGVTTAAADAILLSASAASDMVGNICRIVSGTNFTTGWYQILSVVVGVSITLDRNCTSAAGALGVVNIGGAFALGTSLDDDFFDTIVAGNTVWIKSGTHSLGESVSMANSGASPSTFINVNGYNSTRGDNPFLANSPTIAEGAFTFTTSARTNVKNINFTGTGTHVHQQGGASCNINNSYINKSTSASRIGVVSGSGGILFLRVNAISYRGDAFGISTNGAVFMDACEAHDCVTGVRRTNAAILYMSRCLIHSIITSAFNNSDNSATAPCFINSCTFYGSESKIGTGINYATTSAHYIVMNSIIYGFVTGQAHADAANQVIDDFNNYYNNTTDVSNVTKGANDIALDPSFTSVSQVTGTAGKFAAGNSILIDTTKDFTALGVVAGRDYLYLISGTGITNSGMYVGITSISTTTNTNDTLNLDIAQGTNTTADKVYTITIGRNFAVGTNMKAAGFPGVFPGALTTGYMDIGAVQRQEAGGAYAGSGGLHQIKSGFIRA